MTHRDLHPLDGKRGTVLALKVMPRASKNKIVEVMSDGTVKVRLTAPPVDGKANQALLKFLAEILDVPVSNLEIVAGTGGREKLVYVKDMDPAVLHRKILEHIS
jgi:uncharacterized protein (TIGR00251 family)